ncbi:hypothetical protein I4F81_009512 [Pyropia yezoensis]|uniref:Uncharacterized protein n=1 Tax=Pyropia yezoensis TaxID=2788 RepID=A0ACC3C9X2_PYRYE|nr:hypothetical protein I4F81_009512 [Neopyropia yezoensis]
MAVGAPPGGALAPSGGAAAAVTAAATDLATAAAAVEAGEYAAAAAAYTAAAAAAVAAAAAAATAAAHAHNAVGREGGGGGVGGGDAFASAAAAARSALAFADASTGLHGGSGAGGGDGGPSGTASSADSSRHAAHYENGVALLGAGRHGAAAAAFRRAGSTAPSPALRADYAGWVDRAEAAAAAAAAPATAPAPAADDAAAGGASAEKGGAAGEAPSSATAAADAAPEAVAPAGPPPPRFAAYQSATHVTVDVYVKGVDRAASKVTFGETTLGVALVKRDGTPVGELDLVLGGAVVPDTATWSATAVKVERRAWEASAAAQLGEEDEMGGDPMALFRKLYDGSDDDARRAMIKSYSESNGQVLSMNWGEVAKKKVTYEEKD